MIDSIEDVSDKLDYQIILWILEKLNEMNNVIKWEPNPKPIVDLQLLLMTKEED